MRQIAVVIVNYKTPGLVIDCLHSLVDEVRSLGDCRVIVVENGSPDDSAEQFRRAIDTNGWGSWCELIVSEKNLGFAGGNNVALRPVMAGPQVPDYVLLLNPDTVILPGAIRILVDFLETHPKVGLAGSQLVNRYETHSPQRSAFRFPTIASELDDGMKLGYLSRLLHRWVVAPPVQNFNHETGWVAGASMLVRRQVIEDIGLMDDDYFLYYEETDYMLRARRAGWRTWYVPGSKVIHLVGQATGVTNPNVKRRRLPPYWFESRRRYFLKNHGWFYTLAADCAWLAGFASWRIRRRLQNKPDTDPPHCLWDFIRYNFLAV
jgi:hypothetical protein